MRKLVVVLGLSAVLVPHACVRAKLRSCRRKHSTALTSTSCQASPNRVEACCRFLMGCTVVSERGRGLLWFSGRFGNDSVIFRLNKCYPFFLRLMVVCDSRFTAAITNTLQPSVAFRQLHNVLLWYAV